MNEVLQFVLVLLIAKTVAELCLGALNRQEILANKDKIPEAYTEVMDAPTYQKSVNYSLEKNAFSKWSTLYEAAILAIIIFSGVLPWLYYNLTNAFGTNLWGQSTVTIAMAIVLGLPGIPFEWWSQFKLEQKFGFNRSTIKLWISDKIKGLALTLIIGIPIVWVLLKFHNTLPQTWWLWAFGFIFAFQLLMLVLYPRVIMPLFNKLTPLEEGELRSRLMALADRTGFKASTIHVMDGSKRSGHSNAFFTGFGKFRRIVLFDTLIEQLSIEELEAVLAHEIGHYKKGHIPKMLAISAITLFVMFGSIAWFITQPWLLASFGFESTAGFVPVLILFMLLVGLFSFWFTPLVNFMSRKHEYEADAFAKDAVKSAEPMISSLRKLSEKNLANLTPHALFSRFYYSHPTLLERQRALTSEN